MSAYVFVLAWPRCRRRDVSPGRRRRAHPGRPRHRRSSVSVPTMRDIAAAADVSQSTVSRVLSGVETRVPIAPETRERVIAGLAPAGLPAQPAGARAARRLDEPDRRGGPRLQRPVLRRGASRPWSSSRWRTATTSCSGTSTARLDEAIPLTSVLETRHTDAIVLLGDMRVQPQLLADLRSSRVPVVALWQGTSPLEFPTADTDDRAGIQAGLEHLAVARATGGSRSSAPSCPASSGSARPRTSTSCGSGSAACRPATSSAAPTRWPAATRRCAACWRCPSRRPPWPRRPT